MKKALPAIFVVVALTLIVVTGVLAYNYGMQAGLTQQTNIRNEFFNTRGIGTGQNANMPSGANPSGANPGGANQAGAALRGAIGAAYTVKSISGNTIQATAQDGSTVTINVDAQTVYQKSTTGALTDIQPGVRIVIGGATGQGGGAGQGGGNTASSSGPINARLIQIQPAQ
jgi:hypothetical protein